MGIILADKRHQKWRCLRLVWRTTSDKIIGPVSATLCILEKVRWETVCLQALRPVSPQLFLGTSSRDLATRASSTDRWEQSLRACIRAPSDKNFLFRGPPPVVWPWHNNWRACIRAPSDKNFHFRGPCTVSRLHQLLTVEGNFWEHSTQTVMVRVRLEIGPHQEQSNVHAMELHQDEMLTRSKVLYLIGISS
jgi:hypothetical protein